MVSRMKIAAAAFVGITLAASAFPTPAFFVMFGAVDSLIKSGTEGEVPLSYHPADENEDWHLAMNEVIAYLAGWQQGANPMTYAIRAAYLWQEGEYYYYDGALAPPICWELIGPVEGEGEVPMEGEGPTETILLPGNVPLEMVRIPAGSFQMGSPDTERSRDLAEGPVHTVTIDYDFYLGKYEVTQAQWLAVMGGWPGTAPSSADGIGDTYPAYNISWNDAQAFITALNTHITTTGQGPATMRLPSEAEWEYACRAGTQTRFYFGDSLGVDDTCSDDGVRSQYMWYCGNNSPKGSKPVGGKLPNAFGLYDMSGNAYEWCEDDWHGSYTGAPDNGSAWLDTPRGAFRVERGGFWYHNAQYCRSALRFSVSPGNRSGIFGFRLARQL
ncbi:MAG TPA: formylglycine-generating enzyme family protein [Candidatus Hydrogenedentes bacterium]|nr:formylglycine-generating enzyme family protein [Candidatus Hydrogenedentota bacterium]